MMTLTIGIIRTNIKMRKRRRTNVTGTTRISVCEAVMEVFEITGFADILTIE